MDKFEKLIKDSVEGYQAPYSADAWQSLNKAMGPSKATILKWMAGSAAIVVLGVFGYNYFGTSEQSVKNNIIVDVIGTKNSSELNAKIEISGNTNSKTDIIDKLIATKNKNNINVKNESINSNEIKSEGINVVSPLDYQGSDFIDTDIEFNTNLLEEHQFENINVLNSEVTVEKTKSFKAVVIVDNVTKCKFDEFIFTPSVPKQKASYEWDLGDGTIKTGGIVKHNYQMAGNYTVKLTLRDLKTKKIIKESEGVEVTVLTVPQSDFKFEHSNGIIPNTLFKSKVKPQTNIQWEIVGLYANNQNEFNYSFKHKGDYVVKLTTTAENGCRSTNSKVVSIKKDYNLLAPTAFSPNGDYLNDNFIPKALPLLNLPFTMTIYDRQGKMVFQTTDSNNPWDGLYTKDGIPAPNGVYIWIVQLTNEDGTIEQYQDQITITK